MVVEINTELKTITLKSECTFTELEDFILDNELEDYKIVPYYIETEIIPWTTPTYPTIAGTGIIYTTTNL